MFQGEKIKYKGANQAPTLEIPPDLTSPSRDDRYAVPDVNAQGSATLSTYNAERGGVIRGWAPRNSTAQRGQVCASSVMAPSAGWWYRSLRKKSGRW